MTLDHLQTWVAPKEIERYDIFARQKGQCIVLVVPDDAKRFSEALGVWLAMAWH